MEQLAKLTAELALRLAALPPPDGMRNDTLMLDAIEQLATLVLKEVSVVRANRSSRSVGETSGMWRVMAPPPRQ